MAAPGIRASARPRGSWIRNQPLHSVVIKVEALGLTAVARFIGGRSPAEFAKTLEEVKLATSRNVL
jgi:hypothetical protein